MSGMGGKWISSQQKNKQRRVTVLIEDVYSIYGLKHIYNTFYMYVHSIVCFFDLKLLTAKQVPKERFTYNSLTYHMCI